MKINFNKKAFNILTTSFLAIGLTGCSIELDKSDCKIREYHLHRYEKSGLVKYLGCEYSNLYGYEKTDEVWYPKKEDSYFHFLEMRNNLLKIEDNELYLNDVERSNQDLAEQYYQLEGRVVEPIYRGYKIENNRIIPSDWVDSLFDIREEYPYFKEEELYRVREVEKEKQDINEYTGEIHL